MADAGYVYNNGRLAGILQKDRQDYIFTYDIKYFNDNSAKAISLTLPKTAKEYHSPHLFAFFYGLLAEGVTKELQCRYLKIDENDDFTRLLETSNSDVIGNITVKRIT